MIKRFFKENDQMTEDKSVSMIKVVLYHAGENDKPCSENAA